MAAPMKSVFQLTSKSVEMDCKPMAVPGKCCYQRPLSAVMSAKNSIAIYGLGDAQKTGDAPGFTGDVLVNELLMMREYNSPVIRKLVNEMSSVFLSNQRSPEYPMTVDEVLHYSRCYRAVIKIAIEEIHTALTTQDVHTADFMEGLMRSLVESESAWSFAEIIFFQQPLGGELLIQLLKWSRSHIDDSRHMVEEVLKEDPMEYHHNYWPAVYGCLLQGKMEETIQLLQATNNTSQSWRLIITSLNKMPAYQTAGMSMAEYKIKWKHWQDEVKQIRDQGFLTDEKIIQIAQILSGDVDAIQSLVEELSLPWYSYLLAKVLYTQPYAKLHHIQELLEEAVNRCGGIESFDTQDHIILSILKKRVIDVMKWSSEVFSSWWFVSHFADVFHQSGFLQEKNSIGTTMRESLLLEYGGSLMQDRGLWSVGVHYLLQCPEHGRHHLQEYLTRISLTSTRKALKVLSLCELHGFTQQAVSICRVMARREMNEGRLGSALTWCRQGKDGNMATVVAERFLDQHREQVTFPSADVLDALGSTMLLMSKKLLFLAKLREFHQLCDVGDEMDGCTLLVTLITSRTAPVRYWFLLMIELLPMLESTKVLFTTEQIYDLMNAVSELKQSESPEMVSEVEMERIQAIYLSLTRCLAKVTLSDSNALLAVSCD